MPQNLTLGKGLASLIPSKRSSGVTDHIRVQKDVAVQEVLQIEPRLIRENPYQPRKNFNEGALRDLVESVKKHGILQPLVVIEVKGGYELVAGERRLRAAKQAGLKAVPVLVRTASQLEQFELSLIENLQREDLSPIERAEAYQKLIDEFSLTHEEAARRLSVSRPVVSNTLRYLTLPPSIQKALGEGRISEGQAKVLLELKSETAQTELFKKIVADGLTVEATRREVGKVQIKTHERHVSRAVSAYDHVERKLASALGTKVKIHPTGTGGVIEIEYFSGEELRALVERLGRR